MKEIEEMNIEELRNALKSEIALRKQNEEEKERNLQWWKEAEERAKLLEQKLTAIKSLIAVL